MVVDLLTVMKIVESMPTIINGLVTLASQLKVGWGGSKKIRKQLEQDLKRAKQTLKEFSTLGRFVKDYSALLGLSTDNNNRIDYIIKSMIPYAKTSSDQKGAMHFLEREFDRVHQDFSKGLLIFFSVQRYIDRRDEGKISTFIDEIETALSQAEPYLEHIDFDSLEKLLKEVSGKLVLIAGICATKTTAITERLIAFELILK